MVWARLILSVLVGTALGIGAGGLAWGLLPQFPVDDPPEPEQVIRDEVTGDLFGQPIVIEFRDVISYDPRLKAEKQRERAAAGIGYLVGAAACLIVFARSRQWGAAPRATPLPRGADEPDATPRSSVGVSATRAAFLTLAGAAVGYAVLVIAANIESHPFYALRSSVTDRVKMSEIASHPADRWVIPVLFLASVGGGAVAGGLIARRSRSARVSRPAEPGAAADGPRL